MSKTLILKLEFKKFFGEKTEDDYKKEYANLLFDWMMKSYQKNAFNFFDKSKLLQYGPNRIRNREKLNLAVDQLLREGKITPSFVAKNAFQISHAYFNQSYYQNLQSIPDIKI